MEVKVSAYRQSLTDPVLSSLACQALLTMVAGTHFPCLSFCVWPLVSYRRAHSITLWRQIACACSCPFHSPATARLRCGRPSPSQSPTSAATAVLHKNYIASAKCSCVLRGSFCRCRYRCCGWRSRGMQQHACDSGTVFVIFQFHTATQLKRRCMQRSHTRVRSRRSCPLTQTCMARPLAVPS